MLIKEVFFFVFFLVPKERLNCFCLVFSVHLRRGFDSAGRVILLMMSGSFGCALATSQIFFPASSETFHQKQEDVVASETAWDASVRDEIINGSAFFKLCISKRGK